MKREYWIGIVVAALVVVGVVVGISLAGGDDTESPTSITGVEEVQAELEGLTQAGNVLGEADAAVTIVEYGDIACPACKAISEQVIPGLIEDHVRTGEAKLEFRPIDLLQLASGERGALAAHAAGFQDGMWSLVELLYRNQGPESGDWLTEDLLFEAVEKAGLDVTQFQADFEGDRVVTAFDETQAQATEDQVNSTPTFYVIGPRGERKIENFDDFDRVIAEVGPAS